MSVIPSSSNVADSEEVELAHLHDWPILQPHGNISACLLLIWRSFCIPGAQIELLALELNSWRSNWRLLCIPGARSAFLLLHWAAEYRTLVAYLRIFIWPLSQQAKNINSKICEMTTRYMKKLSLPKIHVSPKVPYPKLGKVGMNVHNVRVRDIEVPIACHTGIFEYKNRARPSV